MLTELSRYLDENRSELGLPEVNRVELCFFKAGGNPWNEGRINFLVFNGGEKDPLLFIKVMREERYDSLDREYRIMEMMAAHNEIAPFLPLPIKHVAISGHSAIIQGACHGTRLLTLMGTHRTLFFQKEGIEKAFHHALTFAAPFNKGMKRHIGTEEFRKTATGPIASFYETFEESNPKNEKLSSILEEVEKEMGESPVVVPAHGDYSATNIFVNPDNRITIIDWETAMEESLPFLDLFYFMSKYIHNLKVRPKDRWRRVREAYFGNNWFSGLIRETVEEYCIKTGFDRNLGRSLFPLHFLVKARIKFNMRGREPAKAWIDLFEYSANNNDKLCF
jgi:hypothetical protein